MTDAQLVGHMRWMATLPDLSGLDADEAWVEFRAAHREACAGCRRVILPLDTDHCHVTGWIRGLLCRSCNRQAGSGGPNHPLSVPWAKPAITAYCQWTPADACGLRRQYTGGWPDSTDQLVRAMWFAFDDGLMSGGKIIELRTIEHMRQRNWSEGR